MLSELIEKQWVARNSIARWSFLAPLMTIGVLLSLCACAPLLNDAAKRQMSSGGALIFSGTRVLGLTYLKTEGYAPGTDLSGESDFLEPLGCRNAAFSVRVARTGIPATAAEQICTWVAGALPASAVRHPIRYEIRLVPAGHGHFARARSLAPFTPLNVRLVVPWYPDQAKTQANLVDTLAHEAFHLHWMMTDMKVPQDEVTAYWVGVCAQIRAGVHLTKTHFSAIALDGVGETGERSSRAAERVSREARHLLELGALSDQSALGIELLGECDKAWSMGPPATRWWADAHPSGEVIRDR